MLISLQDYFQPLLPLNILWFLFLLIFFDVLGTFTIRGIGDFTNHKFIRVIHWLIGFGFFIFLWFIISLFFPINKNNVLISVGLLFAGTLPHYFKSGSAKTLVLTLWSMKIPLLLLLPFLPALIIKSSLPPYYGDEMAYHFMSPGTLQTLETVRYTGGLFANVPRLLNMYWDLSFAITQSYSVARITHFSILVSSLLFAYGYLRNQFNIWIGASFVFIFLSIPQDIVMTGTLGYVDVATYSIFLIALLLSLLFIRLSKIKFLYLSLSLWAIALGIKYTIMTAFISFSLIFVLYLVLNSHLRKKVFRKKVFLKSTALFTIFGGYWYLKNLLVYGNPIYPFFFPCVRYASECGQGGSFFGDWTVPVTIQNAPNIVSSLVGIGGNIVLVLAVISIPLLTIFNRNKKSRLITIFILCSLFIELFILKFFSGFYVRYHQHMQLMLVLAIVIQLANTYSRKIENYLIGIGFVTLIVVSGFFYTKTVIRMNSLHFVNWNEINYSLGYMSIYQWIDWKFPEMKYTINWCENPPEGERMSLARFDPDLIWFTHAGFKRSFITNCDYVNPPLHGIPRSEVLSTAKEKELKFYIASLARCVPEEEIKMIRPGEDERRLELRKLNNVIICNAEEIKPNLYYFDYEKLK